MVTDISLPSEYGYVVFVLVASIAVHHVYMAFTVVKARKRCGNVCNEFAQVDPLADLCNDLEASMQEG